MQEGVTEYLLLSTTKHTSYGIFFYLSFPPLVPPFPRPRPRPGQRGRPRPPQVVRLLQGHAGGDGEHNERPGHGARPHEGHGEAPEVLGVKGELEIMPSARGALRSVQGHPFCACVRRTHC